MRKSIIIISISLGSFSSVCFAQSENFNGAISNTQKVLIDPKLRSNAINQSDKAKQVDSSVNSLVGGDKSSQDEMYQLSAEILGSLASKTGDPEKLAELIQKAQKDPEAFYNSLSEDQKKKIKNLSSRVPANKN